MLAQSQLEALRDKLALRVRELRSDANITQREVARRTGMTQGNISRIERGEGFPQLDSLLRLQHCFGLDTIEALLSPLPSRQIAREDE